MNQPKGPTRFQKRLQAMIKRSADFQSQFLPDDGPIYKLLKKFSAFSSEYIDLLEKVPNTISRNSFVVNNGIEKLLQEWSMLSRASEQHLIDGLREQLEKASSLAKEYCDKWNAILQGNSYYKLETPVVYFEKLFRISRSVYAPQIPLISIPLTDYDQSENWQSLAHEFGHHIFWNGLNADQISDIHQKLSESISIKLFSVNTEQSILGKAQYLRQQADRAELWDNWLEEVFADVYGTLLAGTSFAVSAQDRMAEQVNRLDDFLIADHDHPCIYLRPLISLYVLELIAEQLQDGQAVIEPLRKRWLDFSNQASSLKYKNFSMTSLAEDARKVVEVILQGDYWPSEFNAVKQLASPIAGRTAIATLEPVIDQDPLTLTYPDLDDVALPDTFEEIKQHLKNTSNRFVQAKGLKKPEEDARMLVWLSLAGLELSDIRGYPVHGCTDDHRHLVRWWYPRHYHSQDGSDVLPC